MTANHSSANSHDHGHQDHSSSEKSGSMKGLLYMFPIVLVGIIIIKFLFLSSDGEKGNSNTNNSTNNTNATNITKDYTLKPRLISYGPNYGDITYLPSGFNYYFEGATEPYCYMNGDNNENCGEKGEDATGTFGDSASNKKLRFKSKNGKNGTLYIIFIKQ